MSVDIKATYGATGDGQIATVNATFTATSNNLTVFSNIFTSGDIGKYIAVAKWTNVDPVGANPLGVNGAGAGTTINTISSISSAWNGTSMTVVLGGPAAVLSASNVSTLIEWGHDDTPAFKAFNLAQAGNSNVVLTIPAGRYCFVSDVGGGFGGASLGVGAGIPSCTFQGAGGPTLTDLLGGGSGPTLNTNGGTLTTDSGNVQTVSAGASSVTMVTTADASLFSNNTWGWLAGYNTQGFGDPPNPAFAEYVFITNVNTSTGVITFQNPLQYAYKSTWPTYNAFGPGRLYRCNPVWAADHVWDGVNFRASPTLQNGSAKSITIQNSTFEAFGPNNSGQLNFTCDNVTIFTLWELDKITSNTTIRNSTLRGFNTQSMSPFNVTLQNNTITAIVNGLSANTNISGGSLTTGGLGVSPTSYGVSNSLSINNVNWSDAFASASGLGEGDIGGVGGYSISNGVIIRPHNAGTGAPPQWCVPGSYFTWQSNYGEIAPVWKCIDITEASLGGDLHIQTDQVGVNSFPTGINGTSTVGVRAVAPALTAPMSGNTGNLDGQGWQGTRLFQHWLMTYSGNIGTTLINDIIKIWGQFVYMKVTINPGYSAGTFSLDAQGAPFVLFKPGNVKTNWNPTYDLTHSGRTVTITPSIPGVPLGSDANLTAPNSGNIWLVSDQIAVKMTGAVGAGSVTLEILTDQGFPSLPTAVTPLRLRLHA